MLNDLLKSYISVYFVFSLLSLRELFGQVTVDVAAGL